MAIFELMGVSHDEEEHRDEYEAKDGTFLAITHMDLCPFNDCIEINLHPDARDKGVVSLWLDDFDDEVDRYTTTKAYEEAIGYGFYLVVEHNMFNCAEWHACAIKDIPGLNAKEAVLDITPYIVT